MNGSQFSLSSHVSRIWVLPLVVHLPLPSTSLISHALPLSVLASQNHSSFCLLLFLFQFYLVIHAFVCSQIDCCSSLFICFPKANKGSFLSTAVGLYTDGRPSSLLLYLPLCLMDFTGSLSMLTYNLNPHCDLQGSAGFCLVISG